MRFAAKVTAETSTKGNLQKMGSLKGKNTKLTWQRVMTPTHHYGATAKRFTEESYRVFV